MLFIGIGRRHRAANQAVPTAPPNVQLHPVDPQHPRHRRKDLPVEWALLEQLLEFKHRIRYSFTTQANTHEAAKPCVAVLRYLAGKIVHAEPMLDQASSQHAVPGQSAGVRCHVSGSAARPSVRNVTHGTAHFHPAVKGIAPRMLAFRLNAFATGSLGCFVIICLSLSRPVHNGGATPIEDFQQYLDNSSSVFQKPSLSFGVAPSRFQDVCPQARATSSSVLST
ncbi:hypothetical protein [Burkholderia ubonensis]|uniref:hypothetical protein n=1 Tax=Burkholderia ubonensis TaxID=101571 RepID=UPI0012F990C6|nr:hypothetical protein [Burkholderia ubonensis]